MKQEKKMDILPENWIKYLEQKTKEFEKIKNSVRIDAIDISEWVRTSEHTPVVDRETWEQVQEKLIGMNL